MNDCAVVLHFSKLKTAFPWYQLYTGLTSGIFLCWCGTPVYHIKKPAGIVNLTMPAGCRMVL